MRSCTIAFLTLAFTACIGGDPGTGDTDDTTDPVDTGLSLETCEDVITAFDNEYAAISSCTQPSDCGQELTGTSCGCTRNWVARADADTTQFYNLITTGNDMGCELGLISTCDCPEADGFTCSDAGQCVWNYQ